MESLSLSRTPSAHSLRSPHRRSHPNLTHLSLAPLTPKFPISSSDYDAYISPDTSTLHTSTSYIATTSTPTTPPLLSRSRNTSSTRLSKSKSTVSVTRPPFSGAVSSSGLGGRIRDHTKLKPINTKSISQQHRRVDSEWMLRAGLILADSSRESKGQTWLSKRESSTSLASIGAGEEEGLPDYHFGITAERSTRSGHATPRSGWASPVRSRKGSRRGSRAELLSMTNITSRPRASSAAQKAENDEEEQVGMHPDFLDPASQAEIAADMALELEDQELMEDEHDDDDEDAAAAEEEEGYMAEDELEMQKQMRAGGYGLGGWVDRMLDWTLFGSEESGGGEMGVGEVEHVVGDGRKGRVRLEDIRKDSAAARRDDTVLEKEADDGEEIPVERPKEEVKNSWEDAAWLLRVAKQLVL